MEFSSFHAEPTPTPGLPLTLAPKEGVRKGIGQRFADDNLGFAGIYRIVGAGLRYAPWKRYAEHPF